MYRKKLMRACLAGIMAATVVTQSVPVYAAEPNNAVEAKTTETVEVTFIDEETKEPVGEKVNVEVKDGMINTGRLTAPEGYEVSVPGDVLATPGAGLNVEVRKVAVKTVEVTFIDEETKEPVGEKVNVEVKDGMINTGRLTAPEGYEVSVPGDVLATPEQA